MRHKQPLPAAVAPPGNTEGRHLVRQLGRFMRRLEALERRDHFVATSQFCTAGVRAKFALATEPHDNHARENTEDDLGRDTGDKKSDAYSTIVLQQDAVDKITDDARKHDNKRIQHSLN